MKLWLQSALLAGLCFAANAQLRNVMDSTRTVELKPVSVFAKEKSASQQMVTFFKANDAATLEDILSRLPEIAMIRRGPYGMEPAIRSFSDGQINVLIDGMRMHGACTDKMDPTTIYIEPINLENLQLQTGGSGFLKGSAIGGTVDMKLAEPHFQDEQKVHGAVNSGFQSVSKGFYESAWLNYSAGRWALRASGTYRHNSNYTDGNGNEVPYSQFEKANYSFSARYRYSANTYLKADLLADDGWNIGYPALPMDVGNAKARMASLGLENEDRSRHWYHWTAKIYANQVHHQMDDTHRQNVPMHMDMPGQSSTLGAFAEGNRSLGNSQNLLVRADVSSTFLQASMTMYPLGEPPMYMLTWPDNRRNQAGASLVWQWHADSLVTVRVSGRADIVNSHLTSQEAKDQVSIVGSSESRTDFLKNISAQVSRKFSQAWLATATLGYAERMPTAGELYGFYLFNARDGYDYIGSTTLKTENALNAEASLAWQKPGVRLQMNAFYSQIANHITGVVDPTLSTMTIGAKGVKVYQNLSNAMLTGLELSAQVKLLTKTEILSTLKYTHGVGNDNEPLPFISPLKNITSLRYLHNRFSAQLEYEATMAQNRINKNAGESPTPGYFLVNARLGYVPACCNNRFSLQAGVENIFNVAYREHLDWGNVLRPGRNAYMQLKYSF